MIPDVSQNIIVAAVSDGELLLANGAVVLCWMLLLWCISLPLRNVAIVDIAWGLGFVFVAWTSFLLTTEAGNSALPQQWLLPVLTTLWGVRLSVHLGVRNHGKPEDKRYVAMREKRQGSFWWRSLYVVFLLQGVILWFVSLPLQFGVAYAESSWTPWHVVGIVLWVVGFLFETIGDWQLLRFKQRPENAGKVCDRGLWRHTRHPNYFGDFCIWWGLFLMANGHLTLLWTIISPLLMSWLLMHVSGVTLLESSLRQEKPDYAEYCRRTNAFFPGPPRS